jgi:hypothetical protein
VAYFTKKQRHQFINWLTFPKQSRALHYFDKQSCERKGEIVGRYSYWYKKPKYYWASRQNWLKKKTPSYRNYTKYGNSIKLIAKRYFPKAIHIEDIFHVQKSVLAALQEIRNKHSRKATYGENQSILLTKSKNKKHTPILLKNGDNVNQLLSRSRYLL